MHCLRNGLAHAMNYELENPFPLIIIGQKKIQFVMLKILGGLTCHGLREKVAEP